MKKIIAFAGSNSEKSINKKLVSYAVNYLENTKVVLLDLNNYPLPIYGIDEENKNGFPDSAIKFLNEIKEADGVLLSLAEHNGNFTVAFKNLYDWMSRLEKNLWQEKPMLLLTASPGGRGGASVMGIAKKGFPRMGANIVADFSFPKFYDNFKDGRIVNKELDDKLKEKISVFLNEV